MNLRIATFNVHGWSDADGRKQVDGVIALLREVDADLVVLNEVLSPDHILVRVADALGMEARYAEAGWGGNAILSRLPLEAPEVILLEADPGDLRSAIVARVTRPSGAPFDLVGLHLEHTSEDLRLAQWAELARALEHRHAHHVLAGDFNATRTSDYPPERLAAIARARVRRGWEPARDDLVMTLDHAGYVDAVRLHLAPGRDRYRERLAHPIDDTHAVTSRVGTRIDHIYFSPALAPEAVVDDARTVLTTVSDHHLVVVEATFRIETSTSTR